MRMTRSSIVNCRCGPISQKQSAPSETPHRRALLAAVLAVGAAVAQAPAALAFGSGFPGYDVNMDARKRAQDRIKKELQADLDRGALQNSIPSFLYFMTLQL